MSEDRPVYGYGRRIREWWGERRTWELNEDIRANIRKYRALIEARQESTDSPTDRRMLDAATEELDAAGRIINFADHRRAPLGSHATSAQIHVNAAKLLWLRSFLSNAQAPREIAPYFDGLQAVVREHLEPDDPRRVAIEELRPDALATGRPDSQEALAKLINAVEVAYAAELREKLRAGSFVHIVWWVAGFLFILVLAVVFLTAFWSKAVPLCFNPPRPMGVSGRGSPVDYIVVCPAGTDDTPFTTELDDNFGAVASWGDYFIVATVGLVAAGLAAASALRKIRGTSTAYQIPVALAALKLPAGALTAILGLLLMRGGFVPGLSALDSSAQIIAWAIIFGYSQELFTKFVDRRGQMVLDAVRGPTSPPLGGVSSKAPSPPGPTATTATAADRQQT
ncbi:hypothetical protein [Streptomyces sp. S.PNR 29]|uniref:hypothetical protein n=1 Tax=Streptomyces sp. S.PNR 29 TaxID=2973805 RepID=UPI0025B13506|nr:hypothetical protein [Streptomyces sp. S.PNR 29]MDN0199419.1 hypothetical protein [Streptomyces sp. S.PNR 29]